MTILSDAPDKNFGSMNNVLFVPFGKEKEEKIMCSWVSSWVFNLFFCKTLLLSTSSDILFLSVREKNKVLAKLKITQWAKNKNTFYLSPVLSLEDYEDSFFLQWNS